jgi:hypothetical protein
MVYDSLSDASKELPVELKMPTPRSVRLTGTGWTNVFAVTFFFLLGVALAAFILNKFMRDRATQNVLQQNGSQSSSQVTRKWTQGRSSGPYVSYTFAVDGTYYSGQSEIPKDIWKSLQQYDSLPIRYLPQNPNVNKPVAWEVSIPSVLLSLLYPAFLAIFGLLIVRGLPLQRRLAVGGVGVRGCITECIGPSRSGFALNYTFRNANNNEIEIGSCPSEHSCRVGSNVWVLYLPADPSRSEIYPFTVDFFRINR